MDEPLASLDQARKSEVIPFIGKLPATLSVPILYVTHAIDEVLQLADSIVLMTCGRSVAAGKLADVVEHPEFQGIIGWSEAFSVASMVVRSHDRTTGLTLLQGAGAALRVPVMRCPLGEPIRVRIRARDVALALRSPADTSIQNILPGTIADVVAIGDAMVDVRLDVGFPLLARVTIKARDDLGLRAGQQVFALVKSVAVSAGTLDDADPPICPR